jgi:hypothetical protein
MDNQWRLNVNLSRDGFITDSKWLDITIKDNVTVKELQLALTQALLNAVEVFEPLQ